LFSGASIYFALFFAVENLFTSYLLFFNKKSLSEYDIKNNHFFLINNLLITLKEAPFYGFASRSAL